MRIFSTIYSQSVDISPSVHHGPSYGADHEIRIAHGTEGIIRLIPDPLADGNAAKEGFIRDAPTISIADLRAYVEQRELDRLIVPAPLTPTEREDGA